MATFDVTKNRGYGTLSSLNMAFAGIVQHLQTLHGNWTVQIKSSKTVPELYS